MPNVDAYSYYLYCISNTFNNNHMLKTHDLYQRCSWHGHKKSCINPCGWKKFFGIQYHPPTPNKFLTELPMILDVQQLTTKTIVYEDAFQTCTHSDCPWPEWCNHCKSAEVLFPGTEYQHFVWIRIIWEIIEQHPENKLKALQLHLHWRDKWIWYYVQETKWVKKLVIQITALYKKKEVKNSSPHK